MTLLVDTSVWVDHLRRGNARLAARLAAGDILTHPHVIGELACGHLARRSEILGLLQALPVGGVATDDEALAFLENVKFYGRGLGWIDVHLLASARLSGVKLWTMDRALAAAAKALGLDDRARGSD